MFANRTDSFRSPMIPSSDSVSPKAAPICKLRFSLALTLFTVLVAACVIGIAVNWPQTSRLMLEVGRPFRSKTVCLTFPEKTLWSSEAGSKELCLTIHRSQDVPTQAILEAGFDGPIAQLVLVRWEGEGPLMVETVDVKSGKFSNSSLATGWAAIKAFDQEMFEAPEQLKRKSTFARAKGTEVEVHCKNGPSFRAIYDNDWGYFYITQFQAHRTVAREYERAQQNQESEFRIRQEATSSAK